MLKNKLEGKQMALSQNNKYLNIGFITLVFIAFSRPITTILEGATPLPLHIIIPSVLLYLLLVILLLSFSSIKLNAAGALILVFSFYTIISIAWGSELGSIPRMILPFICYFAGRMFAENYRDGHLVVKAIIVGYLVPVIISAILMLFKQSASHVVYGSGMLRQYGAFEGYHMAAHNMVFFSFFYALFLTYRKSTKRIFQYLVHSAFALSIYIIWSTYVRSGMLGFLSFWMFYLFSWRKRYFIAVLIILLTFGFWQSATVQSIFWKADTHDRERNLDTASSGRITIWRHNLEFFSKSPFYTKLLGSGLGAESKTTIGGQDEIWSSHNDYISLVMILGIIGLLSYGAIFFALIIDIIRFQYHKQTQIIFISIVLTFAVTSMVTNGYVFRFELSQMFWLLMGCSYSFRNERRPTRENVQVESEFDNTT
jgi:O-antigen ligase